MTVDDPNRKVTAEASVDQKAKMKVLPTGEENEEGHGRKLQQGRLWQRKERARNDS